MHLSCRVSHWPVPFMWKSDKCCQFSFQEFKFLRRKANKESAGVSPSQNTAVKDDGHYKPRSDLFGKYEKGRTPFDPQMEEEEHEDLMETNGV